MPRLGAHESVGGGLHLAFDRLQKVGGRALQIFTRNQRQWHAKPLSTDECYMFAAAWEKQPETIVASHASYLVNMASGNEELAGKSIDSFVGELRRCNMLNIPYVVIHPGSHGGDGIEIGLDRFVAALDQVLALADNQVMVLLETTAGQGSSLGSRFEELAYIMERSEYPEKLGICVDTCHIFAAGYDIRTRDSYMATMAEFDMIVGLSHIQLFHLNDSKTDLGAKVDRHAHIGEGMIGLEGFRWLINDPRFSDHPMIIETPKGKELREDIENLKRLRELLV